jgi:MFS family permease
MNNTTIVVIDPQSVFYKIPWEEGGNYMWVWGITFVFAFFGMVMNSITLFVLFSDMKEKIVESKEARGLITFLSVIDCSYATWNFFTAIVHLASRKYVAALCGISAFWEILLLVLSVLTLTMLAYHLWVRVTSIKKRKLPLLKIYSVFIVLLSVYFALQVFLLDRPVLYSSGTYCFPNIFGVMYYIIFAFGFPMLISMFVIYVRIYLYYKRITKGGQEKTKLEKKRWKLLKRFILISISSFGAFVPPTIINTAQWITLRWVPPILSGLFVPFTLIGCITNPLIYFWSNPSAQNAVLSKLGIISHLSSSGESTDENGSATKNGATNTNTTK